MTCVLQSASRLSVSLSMARAKKVSLDSLPLGKFPDGGIITREGDVVDIRGGVVIHEATENGKVSKPPAFSAPLMLTDCPAESGQGVQTPIWRPCPTAGSELQTKCYARSKADCNLPSTLFEESKEKGYKPTGNSFPKAQPRHTTYSVLDCWSKPPPSCDQSREQMGWTRERCG